MRRMKVKVKPKVSELGEHNDVRRPSAEQFRCIVSTDSYMGWGVIQPRFVDRETLMRNRTMT